MNFDVRVFDGETSRTATSSFWLFPLIVRKYPVFQLDLKMEIAFYII